MSNTLSPSELSWLTSYFNKTEDKKGLSLLGGKQRFISTSISRMLSFIKKDRENVVKICNVLINWTQKRTDPGENYDYILTKIKAFQKAANQLSEVVDTLFKLKDDDKDALKKAFKEVDKLQDQASTCLEDLMRECRTIGLLPDQFTKALNTMHKSASRVFMIISRLSLFITANSD